MSCDAEKQRSTPCASLLLENRTIDTVYSPDTVYSHLTPSPYVEIGLVTSGNGIHRIIVFSRIILVWLNLSQL